MGINSLAMVPQCKFVIFDVLHSFISTTPCKLFGQVSLQILDSYQVGVIKVGCRPHLQSYL